MDKMRSSSKFLSSFDFPQWTTHFSYLLSVMHLVQNQIYEWSTKRQPLSLHLCVKRLFCMYLLTCVATPPMESSSLTVRKAEAASSSWVHFWPCLQKNKNFKNKKSHTHTEDWFRFRAQRVIKVIRMSPKSQKYAEIYSGFLKHLSIFLCWEVEVEYPAE